MRSRGTGRVPSATPRSTRRILAPIAVMQRPTGFRAAKYVDAAYGPCKGPRRAFCCVMSEMHVHLGSGLTERAPWPDS